MVRLIVHRFDAPAHRRGEQPRPNEGRPHQEGGDGHGLVDTSHDDAARLRRLVLAGQVVYYGVMQGIPTALGDPYFRLALARAAATAGLDLFAPDPAGR